MKILVFGYGNPGRQDDGLGIHLADRLEAWSIAEGLAHIDCDANYQLNIEDAQTFCGYDLVVVADAAAGQSIPVAIRELAPRHATTFTTHSLSPETVLALCEDLYGRRPRMLLLTMNAAGFEINGALTDVARASLDQAFASARHLLIGQSHLTQAMGPAGAV